MAADRLFHYLGKFGDEANDLRATAVYYQEHEGHMHEALETAIDLVQRAPLTGESWDTLATVGHRVYRSPNPKLDAATRELGLRCAIEGYRRIVSHKPEKRAALAELEGELAAMAGAGN